ncbi:hypothetical protein J2W49_003492 [Hydrogenophaga palleronii]|uniref:GmrSD restriction endonucleases N-terminal domain-containing protein n=1 Tax=Hydrogenophaga palleronii TaxID=65655 RepID=A0ABU1WRD4_9BURK|nr:DUF262 domain-containing protein [Hydrogenophaga palleronii]MDR7151516.1 hypothetical protein [Hydrogenophaga palleronii]
MAANPSALLQAIEEQKKRLTTTSLDLSFNELVDMIESNELNIQPDFQRLFQWTTGTQSRFIESLLLEMPIPPIYVIESEENKYLLIDGLQRISSYLHFRGKLDAPENGVEKGQLLTLSDCDIVPAFNGLTFDDLPTSLQIRLKRYFVRVEVVRHGSDPQYQYYMFKRLNTGGVLLTEQQIRNCTIRLLDPKFNDFITYLAGNDDFKITTSYLTTEQRKGWYDQELVLRFFAFKNDLDSYVHEIGDFLTEFMERVSDSNSENHLNFEYEIEERNFEKTFLIFQRSMGDRSFSRLNAKMTDLADAFGIYHFESLTLGIQPLLTDLDPDNLEQMSKLGEALLAIKKEPEFIGMTKGGGKNSVGLLKKRIAYVTAKLTQALQQ